MTQDRFRWLRRYWQGLLIAAAVSYGQLHDTGGTDVRAAQRHPYVWMLPDGPAQPSPLETVGQYILTMPFDPEAERVWN
ncbi:MAG TPA: hypothetical protein VGR29_06640 [Thermomicrobiales bacterium]|nr:hypothetical protein [Thermomicrobiales bacterium]